MKYTFKVPEMSCGHCKGHIETGLKNWGKASSWTVDLDAKTVTVESDEPENAVARIIQDEGYTPQAL
ncbi:heavy-metal-associated domain-containing protein [Treponema sp. OttesenSCG-928-L16]|nr:heavy-metal-associated domain-containing protein [Treponema sp. OttesenSCG-928-L16]